MNKKILSIILAMSFVFAFTSCKQTPKEPVVVNKANGDLDKIIVQ
jgi:hypothetical protein